METRINYIQAEPHLTKALYGLELAIQKCGLDHALLHLIKLRASQINGCAFCVDMHWKDARQGGESEQRLYGLNGWRDAPYYSDKERSALAWTESLTLIAETHAPDEDYHELRKHFDEHEIVQLTFAIASINAWNRLGISMRAKAGDYQPPKV